MKNIYNYLKSALLITALFFFSFMLKAQYFVDFEGEGEVKTAYASGTVTLSGLDWNMTEILIGTLDADWKNGERSARLRGYGTSVMTMLQDKENGIGNISFYYRRYGTDQQVDWKVEYSTNNGSTWTQVGSAFTAPASDVVQHFDEEVNIDGPVRIRIKRATETGTSNKRLNIDDILVTDFTGGNPSVAKPVFTPSAGQYFGPVEVTITCDTPGADIYYTTDGSDPTQSSNYYTAPVNISSTTTLKARAYAENLDPSSITQGTYNIAEVIEVANLGELRDLYSGGTEYFKVTGEVIVTFTQPFRNQKYIEDATAAILIDDLSGTIVTEYNIGDGITGIVGSITAFGNMLQFNPAFDPGAPTSTGNAILPQVITIEEMLANFEEYESELVKINGVTFSDAGEEFANGVVYPISDNSKATANFRTTFYDVDYIGTTIPLGVGNVVGILNSRNEGDFITSRSLSDLEWYFGEPSNYPTMFEATSSGLSITLTWEDATGEILPSGYLILASDENDFTAPVDGVSVINDPVLADGEAAMNIAYGVEKYTFTNLEENVTYYFRIYPYTGSGSTIDYKTDGAPPAAEATVIFTFYPEPSNYPTEFAATAGSSSIKLTWNDATGDVLPTAYLILASVQNMFQYPYDGIPIEDDIDLSDGVGAKNVEQGVQQFTFTGLETETTYYFIIFSYTNEAQYIDYKTDGEPPLTSATTQAPQIIDLLITTFDESWESWTPVSVSGTQVWSRNNTYGVGGTPCARISGYESSQFYVNEDWLISPTIDLNPVINPKIKFFSAFGYSGPALKLMISTDYNNQSNPNDAEWTDLTGEVIWPSGEPYFEWTGSGEIDLSSFEKEIIRVAFVYFSDNQSAKTWEVDDITVFGEKGNAISKIADPLNFNIYPNPGNGMFYFDVSEQVNRIEIFSPDGKLVYYKTIQDQVFSLNLSYINKGIYLVKLTNDKSGEFGTKKLVVQ
ncbi:MAG: chitobiase/beta-hexosaminidase C-terminal domain-containing protein [Bacteroidales bacterium]|jgi:hypothetical protein|nr:chitobiase/beta-hexosaminidase C-terminal domain-containing protein [Bacteroidales bacterium]MDI9591751.1 chitobiase/beta-hexosaminidase C-terminal domain-containing protein [Bacteroidota bacterium]HPL10699.1 chitobiase/beta-hexosaminidase C-terminal domain-containing protein [Bacteroidales bacterium]